MSANRLQKFTQRYQDQDIPWDTNITPPEIVSIVEELSPGKALDLGCGTGTNVGYLLQRGWQADGIDFVPQAVEMARTKLAQFPADSWQVHCFDVTQLDSCPGLRPPYDLVVDIGCGHAFVGEAAQKYARDIAALMAPGGIFMVYAHQPMEDLTFGWSPDDVPMYFASQLNLVWQHLSDDTTTGNPAGWYRLIKPV